MRIQCDVCGKEEASVFCCADEAALCDSCDRRVHRANKLAGKHRRFSLLHPTSDAQAPRCDVCQEKRAFLFCQEDRAILCRDCDAPIHSANELTMKHNRFLLTGTKVSPTATLAGVEEDEEEEKKTMKNKKENHQPTDLVQHQSSKSCNSNSNNRVVVFEEEEGTVSGNSTTTVATDETAGGGSSSISDYLIKTLPGWRVDDLLLDYPTPPSISSPFTIETSTTGFWKMGVVGEDFLPFMEADLDVGRLGGGGGDGPIWWVPQVPQVPPQTTTISFNQVDGIATTAAAAAATAVQQRWRGDDGFTVPQIVVSQPQSSNKRPRSLWYT